MVAGVVDVDGVLSSAADARVSVFDRGFLYGDSVFEAMRCYDGRVSRQDAHLQRLARSCARVRIVLPLDLSVIAQRVERALSALGEREAYVRLAVTRGAGPMGLALGGATAPVVLVYALPLTPPDARIYSAGITIGLVPGARGGGGHGVAEAKHSNYLQSVLGFDDARQRGADDAVLMGEHGEVTEGVTSNLFLVRHGSLCTPPLSVGVLPGITRGVVFELAANMGIACAERLIFPDDIYGAEEIFLSSSIRELVPVVGADGVTIGDGTPGPCWRALHAAYRRQIGARDSA